MIEARRRVVVTGIGMVTPVGVGAEATWGAVVAGANGVGPITRFDPTDFPVRFAAQVALPEAGPALKARLVEIAAAEALDMARLPGGPRLGVCVGSEAARPPLEWLLERRVPDAAALAALAPDRPTLQVAAMSGATGPRSTVSTACTSSSQAVGEALLRIRRGEVDAMVAGGVDALSEPLMVVGFAKLGALSQRNDAPERASRPFDLHRDGFVLGEGAAFLVLEEAGHAAARGARVLATLDGWGCSCNAWRITDSPPDGRGAAQSMSAALADAGISPADVGYVNAHGTSTPQNDHSESVAIRRVFGDHTPPVSSTKGQMGHLVAACGAVEAVLCVQALRDGLLPPTRNLEEPDPACGPVDFVRGSARRSAIRYALTNAFGFGGSNGSLLFGAVR